MLKVMAHNYDKSDPFAEYLWMGEMDKFDEQVEEELEEELFIKACIEQLLDEEEERDVRDTVYFPSQNKQQSIGFHESNGYYNGNQQVPYGYPNGMESLSHNMGSMYVSNEYSHKKENFQYHQKDQKKNRVPLDEKAKTTLAVKSTLNPNAPAFTLNPNAKVFVPTFTTKSSAGQNGHEPPSHTRSTGK